MSATLEKPRVPAEYRGLGRLFRDEVQRIDRQMDRALATVAGRAAYCIYGRPSFRHVICTCEMPESVPLASDSLLNISVTPET